MKKKTNFFRILKVTEEPEFDPDPESDPLVRGTDPEIRIRIRTKMSRIPNTGGDNGSALQYAVQT